MGVQAGRRSGEALPKMAGPWEFSGDKVLHSKSTGPACADYMTGLGSKPPRTPLTQTFAELYHYESHALDPALVSKSFLTQASQPLPPGVPPVLLSPITELVSIVVLCRRALATVPAALS